MARTEARISVEIWGPASGFTELSPEAQWMYFLLATQRATTMIGTLPLTPRRWAGRAAEVTEAQVIIALAELECSGFAAADTTSGEAWVRPLLRPIGPKQFLGALTLAAELESVKLRTIVGAWLGELGHALPRGPGSSVAAIRLAVYKRDGFACRQCDWTTEVPEEYDGTYALAAIVRSGSGAPLKVTVLELDHVHPESLGGRFETDNLQALCSGCNARKGAKV